MDLNLPYTASKVYGSIKGLGGFLLPGDFGTLLLGAVLVIVALFVVFILKRILENLVIGVLGFLALKYLLGINVPLLPGLLVSLLFGLGGLGVLIILHFFGLF